MARALDPETIVLRLADLPPIVPALQLLVLFGSIVKGRARPRSDVDLAVRCDGAADLDALYAAVGARLGSDRVDIVDLRRAEPLLAFEIARSGRLLFERTSGTFRAFQSLAARRYEDAAKFRVSQRRAIHAFLERQGLA